MEILTVSQNLQDALMIQSILKGSDIEAFIPDEFTVQNDWGLINAIGGIRIMVQEKDLEAARNILGGGSQG